MLAHHNGSLVSTETPARILNEMSPTKEFLTLDTPKSPDALISAPYTPLADEGDHGDYETDMLSPTTPYYLSKGAELIQQTCPAKRDTPLLFPLSGRIEDQPDEAVRHKLVLARRKSLQWAPKVGSPLGRAVSYGK